MRDGSLSTINRRLGFLIVLAGLVLGWFALVDGTRATASSEDLSRLRGLETHHRITSANDAGAVIGVRDVWVGSDLSAWIEVERDIDGSLLEITWSIDGVVSSRNATSDFVVLRSWGNPLHADVPSGPPSLVSLGQAVALGEATLLRTQSDTRIELEAEGPEGSVLVVANVDPASLVPFAMTITRTSVDRVEVIEQQFLRTNGTPVPEDVLDEIGAPVAGSDSYHTVGEIGARNALREYDLSMPSREPLAGYRFVKGIRANFRGHTESETIILLYDDDGVAAQENGTYNIEVRVTPLTYITLADGRVDLAVDESQTQIDLGSGILARYSADDRTIAFDTDVANVAIRFNYEMVGLTELRADLEEVARQVLNGSR